MLLKKKMLARKDVDKDTIKKKFSQILLKKGVGKYFLGEKGSPWRLAVGKPSQLQPLLCSPGFK